MASIAKLSVGPFFATLALAAATLAPEPVTARANFDGNWNVLIMTNSGPCDRTYRVGLSIRNGDVFYNGSTPVNVNGRVNSNGTVRVRVWSGSQGANGAGRLSRDYGRGQWRGTGSSNSCAGSWIAQRN